MSHCALDSDLSPTVLDFLQNKRLTKRWGAIFMSKFRMRASHCWFTPHLTWPVGKNDPCKTIASQAFFSGVMGCSYDT